MPTTQAGDPRLGQVTRVEVTEFEDGFSIKTLFGAIFIALLLVPGGMYLGLVAGQGAGDAAEWVTIVLFAEVARRSFQPLRKQEIYILFYIAASLTTVVNANLGLSGGPFANLVWNAYFIQSPATDPFSKQIPKWAVPGANSPAVTGRMLWNHAWLVPILLLVFTELMGRLSWMGLGYALFRYTSDVEKLPFPYAAVNASGATALSEAGTESWRWGVFSAGTVIGLLFGVLYIAVPVITGAMFGHSFQVFPIPFADYTQGIQNLLPGAIVGLSFSLANVLVGFVLPYEIVAGAALASVLGMVVINPILYHAGLLPDFRFGSDAIMTKLTTDMDFWLSLGIGLNLAIGFIGIALVAKSQMAARRHRHELRFALTPPPPGRGDFSMPLSIGAWIFATIAYTWVCKLLVPGFPIWITIFFGFIWSPLNSFISARMIGLAGRGVSFPYLREASIVASGYHRVDIWYAPLPLQDVGAVTQRFREVELTGTKFTSILKAEALMFVILLPASYFYWSFFWHSNPLPSAQFPYAQKFWPLQAQSAAVIQQINLPSSGHANWFARAISPFRIGLGTGIGLVLYWLCTAFNIPLLFYYGFVGGLGLFPANTVPQFLGAWYGRKYLRKKYGAERWTSYAPVLLAGFSCGAGLISMFSIAIALIAKAVSRLPY